MIIVTIYARLYPSWGILKAYKKYYYYLGFSSAALSQAVFGQELS